MTDVGNSYSLLQTRQHIFSRTCRGDLFPGRRSQQFNLLLYLLLDTEFICWQMLLHIPLMRKLQASSSQPLPSPLRFCCLFLSLNAGDCLRCCSGRRLRASRSASPSKDPGPTRRCPSPRTAISPMVSRTSLPPSLNVCATICRTSTLLSIAPASGLEHLRLVNECGFDAGLGRVGAVPHSVRCLAQACGIAGK